MVYKIIKVGAGAAIKIIGTAPEPETRQNSRVQLRNPV